MTPETKKTLEQLLVFCNAKWVEADQPPPSGWPTPDMLTGQKMAYNAVVQHVRKLIEEAEA